MRTPENGKGSSNETTGYGSSLTVLAIAAALLLACTGQWLSKVNTVVTNPYLVSTVLLSIVVRHAECRVLAARMRFSIYVKHGSIAQAISMSGTLKSPPLPACKQ